MLKRLFSRFGAHLTKNALSQYKESLKIKSWQIHAYGDLSEMHLDVIRLPVIKNPNEVLVHVKAASVNPIDLYMLGGYGRTLFQVQRSFELEFPLTLGRDFSGTVIAKGLGVGNEINIGDEVYGFIPIHKQGSFAETVLTEKGHLRPKPKHLSHTESASLVYTTMTAWSALFVFGNLCFRQTKGLRVLVLGASGGVGCSAIQLLKSQSCEVFGTCSGDAMPMVQGLGADQVFNYKDEHFMKQVAQEGRYHIILDGAKFGYQNIPKSWQYDTYITLNSPLLTNTDRYGVLGGLVYSLNNLLEANVGSQSAGGSVRWGFFVPCSNGFEFIDNIIKSGKIKPVIHKVFKFENLPDGLKAVSEGHLRGKIVIDYD
ncbi:hypothetical protein NQ315_015662 [Exocentrus adspersus]|uniref:Enoyl reductase (ER) domain-containing protein n=1 Tax=Exocentrus adspersus TaxID=1586481 RepID=A0AAV8W317_9CUCU|nr:hypothetical protein NQ315_015662 [Exocentrus adspersus]